MTGVLEVADRIFMIDDSLFSIPQAGSVYFLDEDKKALIDTGPSTSSGVVMEGIKKLGRKPEDISYIILTHIHLDHGGGAGTLLRHMPQAEVVVHNKVLKHLVNPEKLVSSAGVAQGEKWMSHIGEVLPIDEKKVKTAHEGDTIVLGDRQLLSIMETPGHAPHELCIRESRNNGIFVGDAVSHNVGDTDISVPVTPPPSFNLWQYIDSLNRLLSLNAARLYFPHSGASSRAADKIKLAIKELLLRQEIIIRAASENKFDSAAEMVIGHGREMLKPIAQDMKELHNNWLEYDIPMSAREHVRYYLISSAK